MLPEPPQLPKGKGSRYWPWRILKARTFGEQTTTCPTCDGPLRLRALVQDRATARRILEHLGLPTDIPSSSRAPASGRGSGGGGTTRDRHWLAVDVVHAGSGAVMAAHGGGQGLAMSWRLCFFRPMGEVKKRRPGADRFAWLVCCASLLTACDCGGRRTAEPAGPPSAPASATAPEPPADKQWNVLFFLSDALRAPSMGLHGYPRATTPRLAALAAESLVFERHYSAASYTRRSVSQMFTGMLFAPALMATQHTAGVAHDLPADLGVLPQLLHERGYRTELVSSHPWFNEDARVLAHFDRTKLLRKRGHAYMPFGKLLPRSLRALEEAAKRGGPFFLYIHTMDTHDPNSLHARFRDHVGDGKADARYDAYDSEIRYTDDHVGKVLDRLASLGLADDTLVVFTSDHGEEFGEMGEGYRNDTHGANVRRAATHIPLIVRLPKAIRRTGRFEDFSSHLDVMPTVARLAMPGIDLSRYRFDGEDLGERLLVGELGRTDRRIFARSAGQFVMRTGVVPEHDYLFDDWATGVRVVGHSHDADNYPRPAPVQPGPEDLPLVKAFADVLAHRREHFVHPPPRPLTPHTGRIFPAFAVDASEARPTRRNRDDGLWGLRAGRWLVAQPGEDPGPITLRRRIAPGRYRVVVQLLDRDYGNGMSLSLPGADAPIVFEPRRDRPDRQLDAGEHRLPGQLEVTVDAPRDGVGIAGFHLEYLGEAPATRERAVDPALTEQLRALGYVE